MPLGGTFTWTRFGAVRPATKFRFDAVGVELSSGYTVTNPDDVGSVSVTFITTLVTPLEGTPPLPVTLNFRICPDVSDALGTPPLPIRVSKKRDGARPWKRLPRLPVGSA